MTNALKYKVTAYNDDRESIKVAYFPTVAEAERTARQWRGKGFGVSITVQH